MLVGHKEVTETLSSQLPPVSIIVGPPSVGKRLIAGYAAINNNVAKVDFIEVKKLTVPEADRVKRFMAVRPNRNIKFALIDLDLASQAAIYDLLKSLEHPPEYARFSLISSSKLPATLMTRGHKYKVGLLNRDELFEILLYKGLPETDAQKFSIFGRVDLALQMYADETAKTVAMSVIQSVESGDYELFCLAFKAVDEKVADMLLTLLEESAAQNWRVFNPQTISVFSQRKLALAALAAWSNISAADPILAIRVALESLMKG